MATTTEHQPIELLPKNPPICHIHHCTMRWVGYGWVCTLCEREIRHQEEMDILEREVRDTQNSLRPGLW